MRGVLFLGEAGAARAPLAEAIGRHLAPDIEFWSAGARPSHVRQEVRQVLAEMGIHCGSLRARSILEVDLDEIDLVIGLCAEARSPTLPRRFGVVHRPMADPSCAPPGERRDAYRACRDTLLDRIPRWIERYG